MRKSSKYSQKKKEEVHDKLQQELYEDPGLLNIKGWGGKLYIRRRILHLVILQLDLQSTRPTVYLLYLFFHW